MGAGVLFENRRFGEFPVRVISKVVVVIREGWSHWMSHLGGPEILVKILS